MTVYDKILKFATEAHGSQTRKYTGDPYIVHPIAVAKIVEQHGGDANMVYAALLHDVLEDTHINNIQLLAFLRTINELTPHEALDIHDLVVELTDIYIKEDYPNFNRKERKELEADRLGRTSDRAQTIKYADLFDNTLTITEYDKNFSKVYLREKDTLLNYMTKGNTELKVKCIKQIEYIS